jgi:transposase-like protein
MHAQFDRILDPLADKLPRVAEHLEAARADVLAFTAFPQKVRRQIWSNSHSERGSTARKVLAGASHRTTCDELLRWRRH